MVENSEQIKTVMPWKPGGSTSLDKKYFTATVTSYFMQVLLQQICFVLEPDNPQWHNLYNNICGVMLQLKLIDHIYKICDLPKTNHNIMAIAIQLKKIIKSLKSFKIKPTTHTTLLVETVLEMLWAIVKLDRDNLGNIESQMKKFLNRASLIKNLSNMEGFEMVRHEYKKILHHLFYVVCGGNIMCGLFSSRYLREFEEVSEKGSGGCGKVFLAKNRLDKVFYAIKKIKYKTCDDVLQNLTEVRTLASLKHPNIVTLKAVWVETMLAEHEQTSTDGSSDETNTSCSTVLQSSQSENCVESKSSGSVVSKCDLNCSQSKFNTDPFTPRLAIKWMLFVQMPLYQKTLKDYLVEQKGNPLSINVAENIFKQLIKGLNHAHNQSIIHHDIKPDNILVNIGPNKNVHVCLADFGLACKSQKGHTGEGFGTPLYAAPEQRKGQCNDKVSSVQIF